MRHKTFKRIIDYTLFTLPSIVGLVILLFVNGVITFGENKKVGNVIYGNITGVVMILITVIAILQLVIRDFLHAKKLAREIMESYDTVYQNLDETNGKDFSIKLSTKGSYNLIIQDTYLNNYFVIENVSYDHDNRYGGIIHNVDTNLRSLFAFIVHPLDTSKKWHFFKEPLVTIRDLEVNKFFSYHRLQIEKKITPNGREFVITNEDKLVAVVKDDYINVTNREVIIHSLKENLQPIIEFAMILVYYPKFDMQIKKEKSNKIKIQIPEWVNKIFKKNNDKKSDAE